MAQIPTYTAQQGLSQPGPGTARVDTTTGAMVEQLGNSLTAVMEQRQKRAQEKEAFKATNDYNTMQLQLADELQKTKENAPPDGTGVYDTFTNTFNDKRNAFLASIQDPKLREKYQTLLNDNTGSNAAKWSIDAATVERDLGYKWADKQLIEMQDMTAKAISADPAKYDEYLQQGMRP